MNKKTKNYTRFISGLILLIMVLFYTACESELFIELEESDKLIVLNGAITNDSTLAVQVSRTRHILDDAPVFPLENATVRLFREGTLLQELGYTENAWFTAEGFIPSIGETYTIEVEQAGLPTVKGSTGIPSVVPILKLDTASITMEIDEYNYYGYDDSFLQFDLSLEDPAGEDNYYLVFAEAQRAWSEYRDTTVQVVDSLWYNNQWNYFLVDSSYVLTELHRYTDHPYISSSDIVIEATTSFGVLFSDQLIDGKSYSFSGQFHEHQLTSADSTVLDIRLHSISESYYKYLKSRQSHYDHKEDYLSVPVIVYSNVEGGTGFLGGYSTDERTIITFIPEYQDYWYYEY